MIKALYRRIKDAVTGKTPWKNKRSPKWEATRKAFLKDNPHCKVCNGTEDVEVHHIKPFHLYPKLELKKTNLITLCESKQHGVNCHLFIGHRGNYRKFNKNCIVDAFTWYKKLICIIMLLLLSGCARVFGVIDIIAGEDTVLHEGTVQFVEYGKDLEITTVFFEDGKAYTCTVCGRMHIIRGDKIKVISTIEGQIDFEIGD